MNLKTYLVLGDFLMMQNDFDQFKLYVAFACFVLKTMVSSNGCE